MRTTRKHVLAPLASRISSITLMDEIRLPTALKGYRENFFLRWVCSAGCRARGKVEKFFSFLEELFMPINRGLCADSYLIKISLMIKVNIKEVNYYFVSYKQKIEHFVELKYFTKENRECKF